MKIYMDKKRTLFLGGTQLAAAVAVLACIGWLLATGYTGASPFALYALAVVFVVIGARASWQMYTHYTTPTVAIEFTPEKIIYNGKEYLYEDIDRIYTNDLSLYETHEKEPKPLFLTGEKIMADLKGEPNQKIATSSMYQSYGRFPILRLRINDKKIISINTQMWQPFSADELAAYVNAHTKK